MKGNTFKLKIAPTAKHKNSTNATTNEPSITPSLFFFNNLNMSSTTLFY